MKRTLLIIGGIANAAFFLFHVWLGWNIHHWTQVAPGLRGLLEMFNLGGALFITFFAYASLVLGREMLETRLGRGISLLTVLVYGTRAAGEFIFTPAVRPAIVATCVAMAAVYVAVLVLPTARKGAAAAPGSTGTKDRALVTP